MRPLFLLALSLTLAAVPAQAARGRKSSVSPRLREAVDAGRAPRAERHEIVVGLDLRDRDGLEAFLADVQDPGSPRYHRFLTQEEFAARFAPAPEDEQAVVDHLRAAGLRITHRTPNRLLVGAEGSVAALERAFGVEIHHVLLGGNPHFASVDEPSFPAQIADQVVGVIGLDDLSERTPRARTAGPAVAPRAALGSNCCHLAPNDVLAFYDAAAAPIGSGETIVIAGAYAWRDSDVTGFDGQWGLPALPAGSGQVCTGGSRSKACVFNSQQSIEIALDVEYAHGIAPGARILNYMAASTSNTAFTTMYNRIVTDNPGHIVTTSWGACEAGVPTATQQTDDNIFAQANAIGQSWFAASGDNGSRDCSGIVGVDNPANDPHVIGVGGTTPQCKSGLTPGSPGCGGYGSESGWSDSGGGVSQLFSRPSFQTGCGMPAGTQRLVPDVALEADTAPGNYVLEGGAWWIVGGTSDAAPQWAGFLAGLDQLRGGSGLGNPGALLYGLCGTPAFHDVTTGSNGDYSAGPGFDLVTGLGSFDAAKLLAAAGGTATTSTTTTTALPTTTTASSSTSTTTSTLKPTTTTASTTSTTTSTSKTTTTTASTTTSSTTTTTLHGRKHH
jgi:kumamolisin